VGNSALYDGENRLTNFGNGAGAYTYDGEGQRITKTTSAGTSVFVYDVAGKLIAEYGGPTSGPNAGTSYLTTDHLGSTRVVTNSLGNVVARHDYLPFGEEITAPSIGGRTPQMGYGATDDTRQKFTSKERDTESGLDYFEARYYSSAQGRFTSVDDFLIGAHVADPQSWNLYVYVMNSPLVNTDPTGQDIEVTTDKKHKLSKAEMNAIEKDLQAKTGLTSIKFDSNGKLTYDRSEVAKGGSASLRQAIEGAIDDHKNIFQLGNYSGSESVNFAETDAGTVTVNGNTRVTTYQVKIDFADFSDAKNLSDVDALKSFTVGLVLAHEIDHKVSYDPGNPIPSDFPAGRPDISPRAGVPGVIDDDNVIRSQLGLIPRAPGTHTGENYTGKDPQYKGTVSIQFNDPSGKAKFVRWKRESYRSN